MSARTLCVDFADDSELRPYVRSSRGGGLGGCEGSKSEPAPGACEHRHKSRTPPSEPHKDQRSARSAAGRLARRLERGLAFMIRLTESFRAAVGLLLRALPEG
eukprot:1008011-Rhodomonas_salina.1